MKRLVLSLLFISVALSPIAVGAGETEVVDQFGNTKGYLVEQADGTVEATDPYGNTEAVLVRQPDGTIEVQDPFGSTEAIIKGDLPQPQD
jgi:hypothetical protein